MKGTQAMSNIDHDLPPNPNVDEVPPQLSEQEDYFGFQATERFYFPDGLTWIEFEKMNEGKKAKFQKASSRDLVLERQSGNARMKVDPGGDRWELIFACCVDWNLKRGVHKAPVPYSERNMREWLGLANPQLVEDLEKAIRKFNPWLMAEMSVEDIDREIDNLKEMREVAEKREAGKSGSSDK